MSEKYRALGGVSVRDASQKSGWREYDRGDEIPAAVVQASPWLLETRGAAPANVESIGDSEASFAGVVPAVADTSISKPAKGEE